MIFLAVKFARLVGMTTIDDRSTDMIAVENPRTGQIIAHLPALSRQQVVDAFARARRAQRQWARTPVEQRVKIVMRLHDLVLAKQAEIVDVIQSETGKNRASAFDEILDVVVTARHYGKKAPKLLSRSRAKGALPLLTKTRVDHAPIGVVGIIAPWNYPLTLTLSDAIPALLAGNAVIVKPDPKTPLSAIESEKIAREAGLPEGLYTILTGHADVVGQTIVHNSDYLMFTGSTKTGRILGTQAGERLIGYSAELGGKNPMIIARDADIDRAVRGTIDGCFSNSGQLCVSVERIFVHRAVAQRYTEKLVQAVEALTIGGGGWEENIGSLISAEHADRVMDFVEDAVRKGARMLTGGRRLDLGPAFVAPIVLVDVPEDAHMYREEVFGPVVYIETVDDEDQALAKANDSEYGLSASIFASPRRGWALAQQVEAGTVNINEGFAAAFGSVDAPMGGWKSSGLGRRHSDYGLLKYTQARTIAQQRLVPVSGPTGMDKHTYAQVLSTVLRWGKRVL